MRLFVVMASAFMLLMTAGVGRADDLKDVQYDTTMTANSATAAHTYSGTMTVASNSNRYLTLGVALTADTTSATMPTGASATWTVGSTVQDFTFKQGQNSTTSGNDTPRAEIWQLVAPTTGSGTIKFTLDNSPVSSETADSSPTGETTVGSESQGTADGTATLTGTLSNSQVVRSTVSITVGSVTATDDGSGNLTGSGVSSGTITYTGANAGDWSITYNTAPTSGTSITAAYHYGKWKFSGTLAKPSVDPSSVTFSATVGSATKTATDNGSGTLSGDSGNISGTITYSSGAWTLDYATPPDASTNITVNYDHQNTAQMVGGATSFYNVHQTNPSPYGSAGSGENTDARITIDGSLRHAVFGAVATTGPANTLTKYYSAMTERWNHRNGSGNTDTLGAGATRPNTSDESASLRWTLGSSRKWAIAAIDIQPPNTPTEARFAKARAFATDTGTLVTWRTATEVRNLGFRVYRENQAGERVRLNRSLVAGSALFAGPSTTLSVGRSYVFWDSETRGESERYWLEAVDLNGGTTVYGPFLSEPAADDMVIPGMGGTSLAQARREGNPRVTQLGRMNAEPESQVKAFGAAARENTGRAGETSDQWRLAGSPAAKILVDHDGWYRVTRAQLASAGYDPGPTAANLGLVNQGHEEKIRIIGLDDGRLDMEDAIEFYGRAVDTSFTGVNVYWLTEGTLPGRRMRVSAGDSGLGDPVATFPATVALKDRSLYVAAVTNNGDRDNFYGPVVGADIVYQQLTVDALPPEGVEETPRLEIALQGVTEADHRIAVFFNGHQLDDMEFSGNVSASQEFQIDPSWLRLGANQVVLEAQNGDTDVSVTDWISLTWERPYLAVGDRLEMAAPSGSTIRVSGFSDGDIRLFDLTQRFQPVEIMGTTQQEGDGSWTIEAVLSGRADDGDRFLVAMADRMVEAPAAIQSNNPSSWNTVDNKADMVIIAHSDLMAAAETLANYRSAHGVLTTVVDVDDLYDEFSWGLKDPEALRLFLQRADSVWNMAPDFVLLMGDSSFDPRNYLGFGDRDLVPTKILATNFLKTANDDWFADIDHDGLADLAVGRLPAGSIEEADIMVSKIIGYEEDAPEGPWTGRLSVINDAVTGDFDFVDAAEELEALIPDSFESDRIDLDVTDRPTAHQQILDAFEAGRLLVNYDGHGSQAVWVSDDVFGNEDALNLGNGLKLPFVVAMNCLNGLFHDVYQDSLAEALLKNGDGGAVAVWASSALTDPTGQDLMNRDLYRSLFGSDVPTVGEAVNAAKANVTDQDTRNTWIFFGDPSMRLK